MTSNDKAAGCCDLCMNIAIGPPCIFNGECPCHTPAPRTEKKCPIAACSHNINGRSLDKPCSIEFKGKCTCGEYSPDDIVVHRFDGPCYLRPYKPPTDLEMHLDIEKPATVEVGHADSEDDAIEEIVKEAEDILGDSPIKDAWTDWLRTALRSYGDKREAAGREEAETENDKNFDTYFDVQLTEAKAEGRAEFARELLEKMPDPDIEREPATDEFDRAWNQAINSFRSLLESELKGL